MKTEDPLFDQATANWRPTSKERRDAFLNVLAATNSKAANSGAFGGSAHGEECARIAAEELGARAGLMLAALIEARDAVNPHLTPSCNATTFKRWAMFRFVEEAADLRAGRYSLAEYPGQVEYDTHFELAVQRERRRLHNTVDVYLRKHPLRRRWRARLSRMWNTIRDLLLTLLKLRN
jgi:hypothetical protein